MADDDLFSFFNESNSATDQENDKKLLNLISTKDELLAKEPIQRRPSVKDISSSSESELTTTSPSAPRSRIKSISSSSESELTTTNPSAPRPRIKSISSSSDNKSVSSHSSKLHTNQKTGSSSSDNESIDTLTNEPRGIATRSESVHSHENDEISSRKSSLSSSSTSSTAKSHSDSNSNFDSTSNKGARKSFDRSSSELNSSDDGKPSIITDSSKTSSKSSVSNKAKRSSKRNKKGLKISTSNSNSSDSMTDVSPLVSPEKSPNLSLDRSSKPDSSGDQPQQIPYRHITKLNVVFKDSGDDTAQTPVHSTKKKPASSIRTKENNLQWSSESDDDDFMSSADIKGYLREKASGAYSRRARQDDAARNHRQRLLDSAAAGSMDISSLLETVLEFEKQNNERKVRSRSEMPINYRMGEKLVSGRNSRLKKNMSFSNEQVREIDLENQRLLKKITNQSRPSSASSVRSSVSTRSAASSCSRYSRASSRSSISSQKRDADKPVRLYHSALNRLQYQQRIERENMQFLKRLQSAKPTPSLQRKRQLEHYKQQADYMGTTINRNGMSMQKANELTRNAEVVQKVVGLSKKKQPVRPTWQDRW